MEERLFDEKFISKLNNLSLLFPQAVNNVYSGGRKSKNHGSTVEFANFREYVQGDDFRRIDWNAYGRFEKFFIKLFLDERQLKTSIFIDTSESMDFGTPTKLFASLRIAAAFSYISAAQSDNVSVFSLADGKTSVICEGITGKAAFYKELEKLSTVTTGGTTDLNLSIHNCANLKNVSGVSFIISDLMSEKNYRDAVKYLLYMKQQVVLVHVLSPLEINPQFEGMVRLVDSETGAYFDLEAGTKSMELYRKRFEQYTNEIKNFCMSTGVYYLPVSTEDSIESVILEKGTKSGLIV